MQRSCQPDRLARYGPPIQDLPNQRDTVHPALWFQAKIDDVVVGFVQELPGRDGASQTCRNRLKTGIEHKTCPLAGLEIDGNRGKLALGRTNRILRRSVSAFLFCH